MTQIGHPPRPEDVLLVTESGPIPPQPTPRACAVKVLDKTFTVYGYPGEGWFEQLSTCGTADGFPGFNAQGLRTLVKPDAICLDIGASYGLITLALAQLAPNGSVWAFEPDLPSFKALGTTLDAANYKNVAASPYVIGRNEDIGRFVTDDEWRSSCHFIPDKNGTVTAHSIDSLKLDRVDFIKIDAEGSELDILQGAQETLRRCKPIVVMEFNSFALVYYRNTSPRFALDFIHHVFGNVSYFDRTQNGRITPLKDDEAFLRANLLTGFVDDLVCK